MFNYNKEILRYIDTARISPGVNIIIAVNENDIDPLPHFHLQVRCKDVRNDKYTTYFDTAILLQSNTYLDNKSQRMDHILKDFLVDKLSSPYLCEGVEENSCSIWQEACYTWNDPISVGSTRRIDVGNTIMPDYSELETGSRNVIEDILKRSGACK